MRFAERIGRRSADVSGLMPVARLRRRLADIEPALQENAELEITLAEEVAALERRVGELAHNALQERDAAEE